MGRTTGISWTDSTHNFWYGCRKVSQGCKHCYAEREMTRFGKDFTTVTRAKGFDAPLRWKEPRKVFVNSWSDFFIEEADPWRPQALLIMARTPHLTYQVLTKRPAHMYEVMHAWYTSDEGKRFPQPLPNVWLGVSTENQPMADARLPWLLQTPAVVRFASYEPALEAVNLCSLDGGHGYRYSSLSDSPPFGHYAYQAKLSWVICGGESGPGARVCDIDWLYKTVVQCQVAGVACWVKQLGSQPRGFSWLRHVRDRKGANPEEWASCLRVQQFPHMAREELHGT